ncbi:HIT family protein [Candidatus Woesearchaeota archaeon]|nr:HIT family protein [Candidatus Woesearchaeota archaeon]
MEGITPEQLAAIQQQCIFCQIGAGKVASRKVYEDEHVIAVLDINPANPGHILVITKKHYFVMPQIPDEEVEHIGKISKQLSQVLLRTLKLEGTTIFIANGVAAGQKAQHFMMHIIPRKEGDEIGIQISQRQISDKDYDKIHKALLKGVEKSLGKISGLEKESEETEEMEERAEEAEIIKEKEEETKPKILVDKTKKRSKTDVFGAHQAKPSGKSKKKKKEDKDVSLDEIAKVLGA